MEDFKSIIWVLLAVGVFIWQMVQKIKSQAEAAEQKEQRRTARQDFGTAKPTPKPVPPVPSSSFEELLAQMQRQNRAEESLPEPAPEPVAETRPASVEPMGRYARSQEKIEVEIHSLELPTPEARSLEAPKRAARRADTMPRTSTQHGQEDYWSQPKPATPEQTRRTVNDLLRNPADIRAAFVLSEILQRRF
ncbi:hypothetical protein CDA63_16105 [Hymenobacter amundsenii]|uniref:Uncharacterized protein n=1 Tax=Hymenobacter amundsenii TaxID=2006685 RepID=A0A246FHU0_9BACT|nr:hypothetical protein [Hymenobacter amundsenii]OWP62094.1 hypothetical protein CDA63_16105 [Hymenobacter amundsenii]